MPAHGEHNAFGSVAALLYQPGGLPGHLFAVLWIDAHLFSSPTRVLWRALPAGEQYITATAIEQKGARYQRGWWFWQGLAAVV
jgi:hypothetical protein